MPTDPHSIATRLGFDATTVRRLEARGILHKLTLTDTTIHERLYEAHRAWLITQSKRRNEEREE